MKKIIVLIALASLFITSCNEFNPPERRNDRDLSIIPFSNDNQRFGLVDLKGNIIVENEWQSPSSIAADGIVRVKNKDGFYEFYTATSNPKKVGAEYKDATLFSEGLSAVVNEKGFIHYIDVQGNIKFELPDDGKGSPVQKAGVFSEGLARFQNSENLWGFINMEGQVVIKPRYDFVHNFKEGLALVERYNKTTNEKTIGFINQKDIEVIPLSERFTALSDFHEGLAACTDKDAKNQWGYINKKGDKVVEINKLRVKVKPFQNGYAAFFDGSYWGLIDKSGEIVVNPKFDELLSYYYNGLGPYKNSSNEIGFINSSREQAIKCQYEEVLPFFSNTTVVKDKYYVFIDKKGNSISKTYLKYIPIKDIINQYLAHSDEFVKSLYINTSTISDAIIRDISNESVNSITFNSNVTDVINYYKIPKSKLPKNSYQTYIQYNIDLPGNLEPFRVKVYFNESVYIQSSGIRDLVINKTARVKSVEFRVNARDLDKEQFQSVVDKLISKIENAGFKLDSDASQTSWKANASIYRLDRTTIELISGSAEISIKVDFSEYY